MTPNDPISSDQAPSDQAPSDHVPEDRVGATVDRNVDKILDHNFTQLSALLDGELSPDEARFLLRRLQHDAELRGCWERWQLSGNALRGQTGVLLPPGFAARVAVAVAAEPGKLSPVAFGPRWLRWGGGAALAASVAVIALLLARQSPESKAPNMETTAQIVAADPAPAAVQINPVATGASPGVPGQAAQLATTVAVADVPRRIAARRSRGQSQRAAMRASTRATIEAPIAVANSAVANAMTPPSDPFSAQRVSLQNRPWPRALLPGSPANGAFTVDYGSRSVTSPSFYPFEPRTAPVEEGTDRSNAPP